MIALGSVIIAIVVILGILFFTKNQDDSQATVTNLNSNTGDNPERLRRFIDGVFVSSGNENLHPKAVMIENLVSTRPQSGLGQANMVYETLAEGGITRFLAFYADVEKPLKEIGPVRSARPYFVAIAEEYGALYAHAGGSPEALTGIQGTKKITNLDQISGDHPYFWRADDREAPHNLFTSTELLERAARDKQVTESGDFDPWKFKDDATLEERPQDGAELILNFSSTDYRVRYMYDRETNTYYRYQGQEKHIDKLTNEQLHPKNILVQMTTSAVLETDTGRLSIETSGEGKALMYFDGQKKEGTWKKSESGRTIFYDENGREVEMNAGQTWIEVIPNDKEILYNQTSP